MTDRIRPFHIQQWADAHESWGDTYKHGAITAVQRAFFWAETELSVLSRQCLDRRIESNELLTTEIAAWETARNQACSTIDRRFTTADARVKLKRLYPSYQA